MPDASNLMKSAELIAIRMAEYAAYFGEDPIKIIADSRRTFLPLCNDVTVCSALGVNGYTELI